jgi:hypothetical protein
MLNDESLFTPTVAKVLEDQGYLEEAVRIYSHLLEKMPGHQAYRDKVEALAQRLDEEAPRGDRLPALFEEWISLASEYRQLKLLRALQRKRTADGE